MISLSILKFLYTLFRRCYHQKAARRSALDRNGLSKQQKETTERDTRMVHPVHGLFPMASSHNWWTLKRKR